MSAFVGVSLALVRGFLRDRASLFFTLLFPLMFLVLFATLLESSSSPRVELVQIGDVPVFDELPAEAREEFGSSFDVTLADDRAAALARVRAGDADVAVEMDGRTVVAHYTATDQVRAGIVRGTLAYFVQGANQAATGEPARFQLRAESVEDESLVPIQYFTPGLLGWAVATSAAFGAAATLQGWRQTKLLRRLQLSPAPAAAIVSARIVVTVLIALMQMTVFLVIGTWWFGLQLTGSWWLGVPLLVAGTLSFMALGLLAGAVSRTQEGAVNLANFFVLPMAFLSGSFFSLDAAPAALQAVSWAMPLRHLNEGMTDLMVRGQGLSAIWAPLAYVLGFGALVGAAAAVLFRRAEE